MERGVERRPGLSVIVPTLDEERTIAGLLENLRGIPGLFEVVVADGGSADATCAIAASHGARVIAARRGRGVQLRAGAAVARGNVLCFLHADVRLDADARAALARLADLPDGLAYAFTFHINAEGWRYRFVEWGTRRRSTLARLPYGDQGLVLSRATYERVGGFPDLPLMEDVAIMRALRRHAEIRILSERLAVSPRRWQRDGVLRRMLRNWVTLAAYLAGASPERLARAYGSYSGPSHAEAEARAGADSRP